MIKFKVSDLLLILTKYTLICIKYEISLSVKPLEISLTYIVFLTFDILYSLEISSNIS